MAIRSNVMLIRAGLPGTGPAAVWACPANRTAIVKAAVVYNGSTTVRALALGVRRAGVTAYVGSSGAVAAGSSLVITREFVLVAGDELVTLQDGASSAASTVFASGSLLQGDPDEPVVF